jgi:high-affinity iron transporter
VIPTFVIGLREGVEAALIVGIVAAFLRGEGRRDALRWVWVGVALATALCLAVGVGLDVLSRELPYREQEALETIVALVAVAVVTWMIVWMRRHARRLRGDLEQGVGAALARGSVVALVAMAFFAVLREGFESAVFLLAAFDASTSRGAALGGALLGFAVAAGLGWGIYRGGIRIDLARFFRITGIVLVLVAAGLVASAAHSAHEAGWVGVLQGQAVDLTWLVAPGSIRSALLTGMLGLQPRPTTMEVVAYVAVALPLLAYVLWPARGGALLRRVPVRRRAFEPAA